MRRSLVGWIRQKRSVDRVRRAPPSSTSRAHGRTADRYHMGVTRIVLSAGVIHSAWFIHRSGWAGWSDRCDRRTIEYVYESDAALVESISACARAEAATAGRRLAAIAELATRRCGGVLGALGFPRPRSPRS